MLPIDPILVDITQLSFQRENRKIFDQVDIQVPRGKVTAIMGPSGTGKTTLLRLIGGQIQPTSGSIKINGEDLSKASRLKLYEARKKMGMLFQSGALFSDLSVFENVAFPLREHSQLKNSMIRDLVLMKLQAVGLRGAKDLMPAELSGGMARRAALARAIALDPELIMFDEPFAGQDPISMGILVELIGNLNRALDITTLLVSHDVKETMSIADKVYLLAEGKIIGFGSPKELAESKDPWIIQFLQGKPDGPVPFHYPCQPLANELWENS